RCHPKKTSSAERARLTESRPQWGEEQVLCSGPWKTEPGVLGEHGCPTCIQSGAVQEKMIQGLTVATVSAVWATTARESMETIGSPMAADSEAKEEAEVNERVL
ncbi:hypothetical protein MTO96_045057, partial [Rhipicephalus appendiculatus]